MSEIGFYKRGRAVSSNPSSCDGFKTSKNEVKVKVRSDGMKAEERSELRVWSRFRNPEPAPWNLEPGRGPEGKDAVWNRQKNNSKLQLILANKF